jgi:sugar phosphate isomerase/epimerase
MNGGLQMTELDKRIDSAGFPAIDWRIGMSFNAVNPLDLRAMKDANVSCIELNCRVLDIKLPETRLKCEQWIAEARELGIEVWSYHLPYADGWDPSVLDEIAREEAASNVRYVIDLCASWGIGTIVYHPSFEPIPPEDRAARLALCRQTLRRLGTYAVSKGARLAVECLPRTCLGNSADEIMYLLEDSEGLMVCCDVNHLFQEAPEDFIGRLGSRIATTHISDNDGIDERHWLPGQGLINWPAVIDALKTVGYKGPLMYEVRDQTVEQVATNLQQFMKQQLQSSSVQTNPMK